MIHFDETMLQGIEETCRDFDIFCDFLLSGSAKLSKKTGNIGRKDCFVLNKMLMVQEDFEKPGRDQDRYTIINYFYYAAFRYRILEMNEKGDAAQEGIRYNLFKESSIPERYLLLAACFLLERRILQDELSMEWTLGEIVEWAASIKGEKNDLYELPPTIRPVYEGRDIRIIFKYLEELKIARIADVAMTEGKGRAARKNSRWCAEAGKLFPLLCDLSKYIPRYLDREEVEELIQFICGDYIKKNSADQFTGNILKMFEEPDRKDYSDQTVELEIKVRYRDCIRCVRMNLTDTLHDLHRMIQKAFEFDNDHLYAFYVGHGMMQETYVIDDAVTNGDELSADETELGMLELRKGQSFSYLFDFGDMWWFDIRVLGMKAGRIQAPEITKAVGKAPEQYPMIW
ncbi:MAG TPA: plasmid pRiA4b ORF-3 family protein [Candidatus Mediterraneibacter tabaqchaliae]|uniref:Plasmid pRiA4b ORF-3 family protein n=1 Tax=Candidatus Mediterraneibacter tabaqchaliae TaxID=2838689 RepID=A0A9D2R7B3_9FIRM|nr:plasmid pRiA4b ORF-3 family protein [Candidatus Mediterraneibacter tabaqchaliae]